MQLSPLKELKTSFIALSALESICSQFLQKLKIVDHPQSTSGPSELCSTTFKVVQKWNSSLQVFLIITHFVERVEDNTFIWTPNLKTLDLTYNKIKHLAKNAFSGLHALEYLHLAGNSLTEVPFEALEVFKNSMSLQHLDLESNRIVIGDIAQHAFLSISSLTRLLLAVNIMEKYTQIEWLDFLPNLMHLTLPGTDYHAGTKIGSRNSQTSLQTIEITNVRELYFETPLCSIFPNLEIMILSDSVTKPFASPLALQQCSKLKVLDLSGSADSAVSLTLDLPEIKIPNLLTLRMSQNYIESIKQIFFIKAPKLETLDLGGNQIEIIDIEMHSVYPAIRNLYLDNNGLTSLAGLEHLNFLKQLGAAGNQITVIPVWLLKDTGSLLEELDVRNNPFQCSCDIEPFRKWILSDKKVHLVPGKYLCASPDSFKKQSIIAIDLDCKSLTPFYLSITIPFVLLFCIMICCLFRYRWHIKYKLILLYRNYHPFPDNDDFEMLELQYHAYIAYDETSALDEAWVMNDLQPNLEDPPEPLRLCIKSRDFIPGHSIIENINDGIHQSRKTILVLSPNFVRSNWCYHEMQMAHMRFLDDNLDVLVLVLLDDIPEHKITLSLRLLLCKKEYLKWPKDRAGQRLLSEDLFMWTTIFICNLITCYIIQSNL